eukprot:COSAG01_NODE_2328_length_7893_cov_2.389017_2_plen_1888_part_00
MSLAACIGYGSMCGDLTPAQDNSTYLGNSTCRSTSPAQPEPNTVVTIAGYLTLIILKVASLLNPLVLATQTAAYKRYRNVATMTSQVMEAKWVGPGLPDWDEQKEINKRIWQSFLDAVFSLDQGLTAQNVLLRRQKILSTTVPWEAWLYTPDTGTYARLRQLLVNIAGPDAFFNDEWKDGISIVKDGNLNSDTKFGTLSVVPYPFHAIMRWEGDADSAADVAQLEIWRHESKLLELVDLNDSADVRRRVDIRRILRCCASSQNLLSFTHTQSIAYTYTTTEGSGEDKHTETHTEYVNVYFKRGTISIAKDEDVDEDLATFSVTMSFHDGYGVGANTGVHHSVPFQLSGGAVGLTDSYSLTPMLVKLLTENENINAWINTFPAFMENHLFAQQRHCQRMQTDSDTLPMDFWVAIYQGYVTQAQFDDYLSQRSELANEALQKIDVGGIQTIMTLVTKDRRSSFWFLFWHDIVTTNTEYPQFLTDAAFSPFNTASICFRPMDREKLDTFLRDHGNFVLSTNIADLLYKKLDEVTAQPPLSFETEWLSPENRQSLKEMIAPPKADEEQAEAPTRLLVVGECAVRLAVEVDSKKVGTLQPGSVVDVVGEEVFGGHRRVKIAEGRWVSRVTKKGNILMTSALPSPVDAIPQWAQMLAARELPKGKRASRQYFRALRATRIAGGMLSKSTELEAVSTDKDSHGNPFARTFFLCNMRPAALADVLIVRTGVYEPDVVDMMKQNANSESGDSARDTVFYKLLKDATPYVNLNGKKALGSSMKLTKGTIVEVLQTKENKKGQLRVELVSGGWLSPSRKTLFGTKETCCLCDEATSHMIRAHCTSTGIRGTEYLQNITDEMESRQMEIDFANRVIANGSTLLQRDPAAAEATLARTIASAGLGQDRLFYEPSEHVKHKVQVYSDIAGAIAAGYLARDDVIECKSSTTAANGNIMLGFQGGFVDAAKMQTIEVTIVEPTHELETELAPPHGWDATASDSEDDEPDDDDDDTTYPNAYPDDYPSKARDAPTPAELYACGEFLDWTPMQPRSHPNVACLLIGIGLPQGTTWKEVSQVFQAKAKEHGIKKYVAASFQRNEFGRLPFNAALAPRYATMSNMILNARGSDPPLMPDYPAEWDVVKLRFGIDGFAPPPPGVTLPKGKVFMLRGRGVHKGKLNNNQVGARIMTMVSAVLYGAICLGAWTQFGFIALFVAPLGPIVAGLLACGSPLVRSSIVALLMAAQFVVAIQGVNFIVDDCEGGFCTSMWTCIAEGHALRSGESEDDMDMAETDRSASTATSTTLFSKGDSGCTKAKPCSACQGDCDADVDCYGSLQCFQRNDASIIHGCKSGGKGDVRTWDYCYNPTLKVHYGANGCTAFKKCGQCAGDCDRDTDCKPGLKCWQRNNKVAAHGCVAGGAGDVNAWDYCYSPSAMHSKGTSGCRSNAKCDKCQGDCDTDTDCKTGLKCFQRNTLTVVPGCKTGTTMDVRDWDYCYSPASTSSSCLSSASSYVSTCRGWTTASSCQMYASRYKCRWTSSICQSSSTTYAATCGGRTTQTSCQSYSRYGCSWKSALAPPPAPPPPPSPSPPSAGSRSYSFESGTDGWTESGRNMWTRGTRTPSSSTGATKAASGSYFYFLETSSGSNGDISYLISPRLSSGTSMSFYYHMHGATMRTLSVQALVGRSWRTVWSKAGQQQRTQSEAWRSSGTVTLPSGTTQVRFMGMKGRGFTGDMSVDNIVIRQAPPPPSPPSAGSRSYSFESGTDGWTESGKNHWTRGTRTPSSSTGATKAASGSYFYFLETSSGSNGDISYLISPRLSSGTSMSFYYHMHGATMRTLSVQALVGRSWRTVWSKAGQQQRTQSEAWRSSGTVTLPSGTTQVRFIGTRGTSFTGDMSVDNIVIRSV